jgi:hypothetical protein
MSPETKKHLLYWLVQTGPELVGFLLVVLRALINHQQ